MSASTLIERLASETCVGLTTLSHRVRRHPSTLLGYVLRGARIPAGGWVKLEAVRIGGKWTTTEEAWQRFIKAQQPPADTEIVEHQLTEAVA